VISNIWVRRFYSREEPVFEELFPAFDDQQGLLFFAGLALPVEE